MPYKFTCVKNIPIAEHEPQPAILETETFELKDCPFCGKEPIPVTYNLEEGQKYQIFCSACHQGQTELNEVKQAVELWNMRISND